MTIEDFKKIYFMEWFHRILGRTLGLAFVLPAIYFTLRGRITTAPDKRLAILGAFLIGFQGFLGWFMVRSGLELDMTPLAGQITPDPNVVPRVSQYRLAAHLGTAIVLYAGMLWRGLSILRDRRASGGVVVSTVVTKVPPVFRAATLFTTGLVFLTAMSGM
jgi:cytochrome c oxidase assembly protein subunit 15